MVELHFHALHGLDDGPETVEDSLELLGLAVLDGTRTVVATPHVRGDFVTDVRELPERVRELRDAAAAHGIAIDLRTGGELGADMVGRLTQAEFEIIAQGPATAPWLLVEAPWQPFGEGFHEATAELRDRGFGVLIAHPERSADAALDGSAGLRRELAEGSLAQVNAGSITGLHGAQAQAAAMALIREGLVGVVASDAHGPARPPLLSEVRRLLGGRLGEALTVGRPRGLLQRRGALVA